MKEAIYLIIGLVVGIFVGHAGGTALQKHKDKKILQQIQDGGFPNQADIELKQKHLSEVLSALSALGQVSNDDVEKSLGVSDATAERYLNDLERQGKIIQVGRTGRNVIYKKA